MCFGGLSNRIPGMDQFLISANDDFRSASYGTSTVTCAICSVQMESGLAQEMLFYLG